jgi:hypothetical protein
MKHLIVSLTIGACLLLPSAGMTLAGKTPTTKQPGTNAGVNCGTATGPNIPGSGAPTGGAAMAQGSPFANGTSGAVYANTFNASTGGNVPSPNAPSAATSQYDIACAQVP